MPVIAVVNRKGGSGKSTISTHLAAWCAQQKLAVMLGDIDRQQSTRTWLRLRGPQYPAISPWAMDNKNMLRPPTGVTHVVLDTPGGMHGLELARVVMFADAILMPVCNAVFDRESAASCFNEMKNLPRVLSGRCKVGAIAMRMDNLNTGVTQMRAWADGLGVPMIGALGDHPIYVECAEQGLTIFDRPAGEVADDLKEWQPILDWLEPVLNPVVESPVLSSPRLEQAERPVPPKSVLPSSSPSLRPQTPLPPLSATTVLGAARAPSSSTLGVSALPPNTWASRTLGALRPGGVLGGGANKVAAPSAEAGPSETAPASGSLIPRFLQRPEAK